MAEGGDFARADAGPLRARILAGLFTLLAALLLAALIILVQRSTEERDAAQARRQHSFNVILLTGEVDGAMARAEAALGRAIINTDREKGTLFYDEWQTAGTKLSRLRSLMRDDPPQLARLDALQALYDKRGDELRDAATRLNYKQNSAALSIFGHAGRSDDVLDIALLLRQIIDSERVLLDERDSQALASSYRSNLMTKMMSAVGAVLMLSAIAAGWMLVTALNERRIANEETLAELDRAMALERAVAQRTEELSTANRRLLAEAATREEAEAKLRQVQKMEAVGQLTGGVAHDFNNLLTIVKSAVEMLKLPSPKEERRARYVGAIDEAVGRAAKLTQQLLAFARRQTLKPETFDANANIHKMSEMMQTLVGARVSITRDFTDDALCVNADTNQFDTALVNMAVNARDAMEGEGHLTIAIRATDMIPAIRERPAVTGAFVAISITDTGSGIAPADRERIFEPFYTTKEVGKGTGLGLSQVFGFARQSGGEIQVESEVGAGSRFTLYLPQVETPALAEPLIATDEPEHADTTPCVLVVEDNAEVAASTVDVLDQLGFRTVLAINGVEGLREIANDAERFDVVFSDVVMPGMTGIEMGKEIRRIHGGLPVVLASGYSHVLAAGGTDGFELIHKPYSIDQVSRILRRAAATRDRPDKRAA